jgi:hypothetical protein
LKLVIDGKGSAVMRFLALAAALAVLSLTLPAASRADNNGYFTDPSGDNQGGYGLAPDISFVAITTKDAGQVRVQVGLYDPGSRLADGQGVGIFIDWDANAKTGDPKLNGIDSEEFAFGSASGQPTFQLCDYSDRWTCSGLKAGEASDKPTGTSLAHVLTFSTSQSNWFHIKVFVVAYKNQAGQLYSDRAPDSGSYSFNVGADPDGDGYSGQGDACPTVPAGKVDLNKNGCPDRLPVPKYVYGVTGAAGGLLLSSFQILNAPNGTTATVRLPGRSLHRAGSGALAGMAGRTLRVGSSLTILYSHPQRPGRFVVLRVTPHGLKTVTSGCTQIGSTRKLSRCPAS